MTHQEIVQKVEWKDLVKLSVKEMLIENNLTIPWFVISLTLAYYGYYLLALPFSGFFFLTGLRQVHNGFHNSLGTTKFLTWLSFYINSVLMIVSIHAVKFNHLRHHRYCLEEEDYEGKSAKMTWGIWKFLVKIYTPFILLNIRNWSNIFTFLLVDIWTNGWTGNR